MLKYLLFTTIGMIGVQASANQQIDNQQLELYIQKMSTSYAARQVCVSGNLVVGTYGVGSNWSNVKTFIAYGNLQNFPKTVKAFDFSKIKTDQDMPILVDMPTGPEDWGRFPIIKKGSNGMQDNLYLSTGSIKTGTKSVSAVCAFENGLRLE